MTVEIIPTSSSTGRGIEQTFLDVISYGSDGKSR